MGVNQNHTCQTIFWMGFVILKFTIWQGHDVFQFKTTEGFFKVYNTRMAALSVSPSTSRDFHYCQDQWVGEIVINRRFIRHKKNECTCPGYEKQAKI